MKNLLLFALVLSLTVIFSGQARGDPLSFYDNENIVEVVDCDIDFNINIIIVTNDPFLDINPFYYDVTYDIHANYYEASIIQNYWITDELMFSILYQNYLLCDDILWMKNLTGLTDRQYTYTSWVNTTYHSRGFWHNMLSSVPVWAYN